MNEELHRRLVSVARLGRYVIYSEIAPLLGLDMSSPADRTEIGRLLGEVSVFEHQLGHPLLSAIVIHRDNNIPGPGFFQLAQDLGIYDGNDDLLFFVHEFQRVRDYWRQH
jgi:hypothetical protein